MGFFLGCVMRLYVERHHVDASAERIAHARERPDRPLDALEIKAVEIDREQSRCIDLDDAPGDRLERGTEMY